MCSYCCVLMYSSNCPRRVTKRRSISERGQENPCKVRYTRPRCCRERRKNLSKRQRLRDRFLRLASRKFQVFHEYHRHSTHAFCPFLYKTTLSIRSLIFCSPFPVIIYPSLLISRILKAVCTLDRNKKYISHKQVNGFYKPNSSISFFTSSFFSSEMLRLSLISSIACFLPPQNNILHHLRT